MQNIQPVIVDFIGLPGCGKSTLLQHLVVELKSNGYKCPSLEKVNEWRINEVIGGKKSGLYNRLLRSLKWRYITCFYLQPKISFWLLMNALKVRPLNKDSHKASIYLARALNFTEKLKNKNKYDVVLLDEIGLNMLFVIQLYGSKFSKRTMETSAHVCQSQIPRLVFYIDIPPQISLQRIRQRAGMKSGFPMHPIHEKKYDLISDAEALQINKQRADVLSLICSGIKSADAKQLIRLDGRKSPEELVSTVFERIEYEIQKSKNV